MIRTMLSVMLVAAVCVGCVTERRIDRRLAAIDPGVLCHDRHLNVTQVPGKSIDVGSRTLNVCRGFTVFVHIRPAASGRVSSSEATWIEGTAGADGEVSFTVPDSAELKEYKYLVTVNGVGEIDPYVRVIR